MVIDQLAGTGIGRPKEPELKPLVPGPCIPLTVSLPAGDMLQPSTPVSPTVPAVVVGILAPTAPPIVGVLAPTDPAGVALQALLDPAAAAAFADRFGSGEPLSPLRFPLSDLLTALKLPQSDDGVTALMALVGKHLPATAGTAPGGSFGPTSFAALVSATKAWEQDWAKWGGRIGDLASIRSLERFVTGQEAPPYPATVNFGDAQTKVSDQTVAGTVLRQPVGTSAKGGAAGVDLIKRLVRPETAARLTAANVVCVILPENAEMTDLPEFRALRGTLTPDGRHWEQVRGVGDMMVDGQHVVCLPEESLLQDQHHDPQPEGYSAALHELSHVILRVGLPDDRRRAITSHYANLAQQTPPGPFTDAYAGSNVDEYFAQCSCAFFGVNKGQGKNLAFLQANDPWIVEQLTAIYGPSPVAAAVPATVSP